MTAKEYLMQYRRINAELENIEKNLKKLQDERDSLAISYDGMPHGTAISDKTARLATRMADAEWDLIEVKERLLEKRREITRTIAKVRNADYSKILYMRYIDGLTWEKIAVAMNYSERHVQRLHGGALLDIGRIMKMS